MIINNSIAIDAGGLTSGLSMSAQQRLKALLLTHQHYDHIRDIPIMALSHSLNGKSFHVYATPDVRNAIETHLLNGQLYPRFHETQTVKPAIVFQEIQPYISQMIDQYEVLAVPVNHTNTTVGYQISDNNGRAMFYSADTGPGLSGCWPHISPQLVVIDMTVPNKYDEFARKTGHLTPALLYEELVKFQELKGYLPRIITVHMNPLLEKDLKEEAAVVAKALGTTITLAHEDMRITI